MIVCKAVSYSNIKQKTVEPGSQCGFTPYDWFGEFTLRVHMNIKNMLDQTSQFRNNFTN